MDGTLHEPLRRRPWLRLAAATAFVALAGGRAAPAARAQTPGLAGVPGSARRSALVVGNAAYPLAALQNAVRDARLVAQTLERIGFEVTRLEDATRERLGSGLRQWLMDGRDAASRFFYFAGHGSQWRGRNYLLPIDADIASVDDVPRQGLDISEVGEQLSRFPQGVNILVLDACRNQPFPVRAVGAGGARSVSGWLAPGLRAGPQPQGTLIAFATSPGSVAEDGGKLGNSVYTRHLAAALDDVGVPVEALFKRVRTAVARETSNRQVPWETSSLVGDYCLVPGPQGRCEPARSGLAVDLARTR